MMHKTCAMAGGITTVLLLLLCVVAGTVASQQSAESQQTPAASPGAVSAAGGADYEATVMAMGRTLEVLAQDMATTLRSMPQPATRR